MRRLPVVILSLTGLLAAAPGARADRVAFECGSAFQDICSVASDGSGRTTLLTGATGSGNDRYASPSLSADGTKLGYLYKGQSYVREVATATSVGPAGGPGAFLVLRMRPDGAALAVGEFSGGAVCVYATDLTGRQCVGRSGDFGFAANGDLLAAAGGGAPDYRSVICRLPLAPADGLTGCHGTVLSDPAVFLTDPSTSPDGTKIAVTRSSSDTAPGRIGIYDAATGALTAEVSAGPDSFPVWSPDSRSVAFTRQTGGVWIASASGTPGAERELVADGRSPTWGAGGAASPPSPGGAPGGGGPTSTPPAATCRVPPVTGLSLGRARLRLSAAHCATPKIIRRRTRGRGVGKVLAQTPRAGTSIARTRHPTLVVGRR